MDTKRRVSVILEKSKFNGVGKVEVWSQSSSEDEKNVEIMKHSFPQDTWLWRRKKCQVVAGASLKKKKRQSLWDHLAPGLQKNLQTRKGF